jgi:nitroreductase
MDALEALLGRNSAPRLCAPAPAGAEREQIFRAALRAPDHARLQPWRFLVVEGSGLAQLGELFAQAAAAGDPSLDAAALAKVRSKPLRAPLVVIVVVRLRPHPKVPALEQQLSAGAAAHAMLLAAHAQGYAGIWRTGAMARDSAVQRGLGLAESEDIVGFLYLGTRSGEARPLPDYRPEAFFQAWPPAAAG